MKTQEQLNQDYDKIMIDFKQKAFIEASLKHEHKLEDFVSYTYKAFANHFNNEYKHIYLKPLCDLQEKNNSISEKKQTFFAVSKSLPSTFWSTDLGERVVEDQARLIINSLFNLPLTEERKIFLEKNHSSQDFSPIKELNNTDKIKIQENYSEFVDSFINSPILPESVKLRCFDLLVTNLSYISKESSLNNTLVDFKKDSEFIKEVLLSVKLNVPYTSYDINNLVNSIFQEKNKLKP